MLLGSLKDGVALRNEQECTTWRPSSTASASATTVALTYLWGRQLTWIVAEILSVAFQFKTLNRESYVSRYEQHNTPRERGTNRGTQDTS